MALSAQVNRSVEDAHGLATGTKAPLFKAMDEDSSMFSLEDALLTGPVVIIFYRGHWCPYCNKHLERVQDSLQLIYSLGARVVAVSPQKPEYLGKMSKKTGAEFSLLYDEGYRIADAYDVTFTPEARQLFTYNKVLMANLKKTQSDESQRLPVPATYIINREGIVVWKHFNPDYKKRSTVYEIMQVLTEITDFRTYRCHRSGYHL